MKIKASREIIAIGLPLVACLIQLAGWRYFSPLEWLLFYPAVFYSSLIGSRLAGVVAVAESALLGLFFFSPERFSFRVTELNSIIGIFVFCLTGLFFVFLHQRLTGDADKADLANRAKSEFLAAMSHEIRTPLGVIMGYSEMLQRGDQSPSNQKLYSGIIYRSVQSLLAIINDILDLSKVEAGKMPIQSADVQTLSLLRDVFTEFNIMAGTKGLSLKVNIVGSVPDKFRSDASRIHQIIVNLVSNAIKFTDKGSVEISVEYEKENNSIKFVVTDTGCGIGAQNQDDIFEPFLQVESGLKRKYGGTGLGLSLARKLAQNLGGDVVLKRSEVGVGSIFEATVSAGDIAFVRPVDNQDLQVAFAMRSVSIAPADSSINSQRLSGRHILVIDDCEDLQDLLHLVLTKEGAVVERAANALAGIEKAIKKGPYDIILMDIQMPGMTGYEAVARLRQANCRDPIVAITANAMRGEQDRCLSAGCDGYLSKPVKMDALIKTIRDYMKGA
jgi:signal transduction histidine kinase/ActR/RegA family two-component response regulator